MKIVDAIKQLSNVVTRGGENHELTVFQWGTGSELATQLIVNDSMNVVEVYTGTKDFNKDWVHANRPNNGYAIGMYGDSRFCSTKALMPDGRSIEQWYQCDIKGYDVGGTNWEQGVGNDSLIPWTDDQLWNLYLGLWQLWAIHNFELVGELADLVASTQNNLKHTGENGRNNPANALVTIINNWFR